MATKSTDAEILLRVRTVCQCIINGYRYDEIVRYCEEHWRITSRASVHKYMTKAKSMLGEMTAKELEECRSEAMSRYLDLYKKAYDEHNYTECRLIQGRMDKINGLESLTLKGEGGFDLRTFDVKLTEKEYDEYAKEFDSIFSKKRKPRQKGGSS